MRRLRYLGAMTGLLMAQSAHADAPTLQALIGNPSGFKISAAVRVRYETLDGQPRAGLNVDDEQLAIRSTLLVEYKTGPMRIVAQVDDSRAYLGKAGSAISANDVNVFEPVQAYLAYDFANPFGQGSRATLQAGRFTMNLGSKRFVSSDDYRNSTSSYTGLRADLRAKDGTSATLFYLLPQVHRPDDLASVLDNRFALDKESFDLQLFGGVINRPHTLAGGAAELGYYRLLEQDAPGHVTRDRDLHTFSARLVRDPQAGRIDFELEGAWQLGRTSVSTAANAARQNVDAGMIHAGIGYTFVGAAKARIVLAYDWVSGDRPGGDNTRFDTMFGGRRFEFAPSGIFNDVGRANISSPAVRLEASPGKLLDFFVMYRPMWLASRNDAFSTTGVQDRSGGSGSFAGHLIDARVRYWLVPGVLRGEVNYDWIGKGTFLKSAPNAPRAGNTNYLTTTLTASF